MYYYLPHRKNRKFQAAVICTISTLALCIFCTALRVYGQDKHSGKSTYLHLVSSDTTDKQERFERKIKTVVIDAGHGGEDGGTQSASGIYEKDINLAVALMLRDYLSVAGIPTVMTRDEDVLLYDKNSNYQGRKKIMDLTTRLNTAQNTPSSLFISIHMNSFPQAQYSGLQVWYSKNDPMSAQIAQSIQDAALLIDPHNNRKIKAAGDNIYILHKLSSPAVLVECGFLSNPDDASKLATEEYQRRLAFVILTSILQYID